VGLSILGVHPLAAGKAAAKDIIIMKFCCAFPLRLIVTAALLLALAGAGLSPRPSLAAPLGGTPTVTVTPSTALSNQAVSVTGTGFTASSGVTVSSVSLGGVLVSSGKINSGNTVQVDSAGNFVAIVLVPVSGSLLAGGSQTLTVVDSRGSQASVTLTIATPSLSVSPGSSGLDSKVTVTGTNFPVSSSRVGADTLPVVNIQYEVTGLSPRVVAAATPDASGKFTTTFQVPLNATATTNTVRGIIMGGPSTGVTATHAVPAASLTLSPATGKPETTVTITGTNLRAYSPVREVAFAHVSQVSATPIYTDATGKVTLTLVTPLLENGVYPVRVQVGDISYILPFTLEGSWYVPPEQAPPSVEPGKGLAPVSDNLLRVWNQNNSTKSWTFFDPDPDLAAVATLTKLVDGWVYWVRVKADQTVKLNGKERALFQGWNLIVW